MEHQNAWLSIKPADDAWPDCLTGQLVFHATPLHYLPSILATGALYAKSLLAAHGIRPRATAFRRDLMLGLGDCVHLSFDPITPLLLDKIRRGYPHVVLGFDAVAVAGAPGSKLLPVNAKAWRSRSALKPIEGEMEMAAAMTAHKRCAKFPSIELLARYAVGTELLKSAAFASAEELDIASRLLSKLNPNTEASLLPPIALRAYKGSNLDTIRGYFELVSIGNLVTVPDLPFD